MVAKYHYDAWGNILTTTGTLANTLGTLNPLTYRGYVYDQETQLYYLQSRYYNPTIGRFINADALVSTGQGLLGNNMFAYCRNNPVRRVDISGAADADCFDDGEILSSDELEDRRGGGGGGYLLGNSSGDTTVSGNTQRTNNPLGSGNAPGSNNTSEYSRAPKQGVPGSTYIQISSDGTNTVRSSTTYNEYGMPGQRIDYDHSHGSIGAPHVHAFSYAVRENGIFRIGEEIYPYRK